jgi:hypothetical protein
MSFVYITMQLAFVPHDSLNFITHTSHNTHTDEMTFF